MTAETRFEVPALLRKHDVMSEIIVVIGLVGDPFGTITRALEEAADVLGARSQLHAVGGERPRDCGRALQVGRET